MEDTQFRLLTDMLRSMKNEDMKHSDLETAINYLIKNFDKYLSSEQKNIVLKEFLNFERIKRERTDRTKFIDKMEEEERRATLYSFFNGDEIGL